MLYAFSTFFFSSRCVRFFSPRPHVYQKKYPSPTETGHQHSLQRMLLRIMSLLSFENISFYLSLLKFYCYFSARAPGWFAEPNPVQPKMPYLTPHPATSPMFAGLSRIVQKPPSEY